MITFALLFAASAVAACSGDDNASSTATRVAPTATVARPTEAPTPDTLESTVADGQRELETIRKLSVEIGPRVSGSPQEIVARDYLASELVRYGYDVTTPAFTFDASQFLPTRVDIGGEPVLGIALRGTAAGTVSGPLVAVGIGEPKDFPAAGLAGAIALVERGGDVKYWQKVENAITAGAAGVIIYNNEDGRIVGSLDGDVSVPVAGITKADGDALIVRLNAEAVTATIAVQEADVTSFNVVAKPKGAAACDTVTGGHYDSVPVTGGANDNASGSAALLETARVTAARRTPGVHCFALFGAEEFGLFGSREFVAMMTDAEINALRGMVNLDVVGLPQELELIGSEDLVRQAGVIADGMGLPSRPSFVPSGLGSDHLSFLEAGVPVIFLYRNDPLIHTPEDAIGRMSPDSLAQTVEVTAALLAELGN